MNHRQVKTLYKYRYLLLPKGSKSEIFSSPLKDGVESATLSVSPNPKGPAFNENGHSGRRENKGSVDNASTPSFFLGLVVQSSSFAG